MLYDLGVWLAGLTLLAPVLVLGLAWTRSGWFYSSNPTPHWRRVFYRAALAAGSASTLTSLGYWSWRLCGLYQVTLPFTVLLSLERSIYVCRLLSVVAIVCLFIGRGPYRVVLTLATLWVMLQLWGHGDIIHWA